MRKFLSLAFSALLLSGLCSQSAEAATPKPRAFILAQSDSRPEVVGMTAPQAKTLQSQIDETLKKSPGGTQVSANEIAWRNGTILMSFPVPGQDVAPPTSPRLRGEAAAAHPNGGPHPNGSWGCYETSSCNWWGCPFGAKTEWYCLYADSDFRGRRLQWSQAYNYTYALDQWNFEYQASSWVNTSRTVEVEVWGPNETKLWVMKPRENFFSDPTSSSYVGDDANDKATSFTSYGR